MCKTIKHYWEKLNKSSVNGEKYCVHELRLNIVKLPILFKLICRLSIIPNKILTGFFVEINKLILRLIWKGKGPRIAKMKNNKVGGHILPDFNTYKALVIETVWYYQDGHIDQWNIIENPEIDPYMYD